MFTKKNNNNNNNKQSHRSSPLYDLHGKKSTESTNLILTQGPAVIL